MNRQFPIGTKFPNCENFTRNTQTRETFYTTMETKEFYGLKIVYRLSL